MLEERLIFSAWLCDLHRDHIDLFDRQDFEDVELFNAIRKGFGAAECAVALNRPLYEILKLQGEHIGEAGYYTALSSCLHQRLARLVKVGTIDFSSLRHELQRADEAISGFTDLPSPIAGYTKLLEDDAADLRSAPIVSFGLPTLDGFTHGLRPGRLYAIAARPKVGKTAFALQLAARAVDAGAKSLYFSLEMTPAECLGRMAVADGALDVKHMQSGNWTLEEMATVKNYADDLEHDGKLLFFSAAENDLQTIQRLVQKHKPAVVFIDQLSKVTVSGERFSGIYERYTYITDALKKLSLVENCAVVLLAQLRRNGDEIPTADDLKGSGSIEEDADAVIILSRIPVEEANKEGYHFDRDEVPIFLNLERSRNCGTCSYLIGFYPARFRFMEQMTDKEWNN